MRNRDHDANVDVARVFVNAMRQAVQRINAGRFLVGTSPEFKRGAVEILQSFINGGVSFFLDSPPPLPRDPKSPRPAIHLVVDNTRKKKPRAGSRRRGAKQPQQPPQPEK